MLDTMPDAMLDTGLAAVFTVFVWWFATGAVLYLQKLPRSSHPATLSILAGLAVLCVWLLVHVSGYDSVEAAYVGFTAAIIIWGWHEAAFLMGFITGVRPDRLPHTAPNDGWAHFAAATRSVIHHELALLGTAAALLALTWGAENQIGAWTFAALWVLRISAKLNIFFGVPNLNETFLPAHLDHLKRYFGRQRINRFFPLSVAGATLFAGFLGYWASEAATPVATVGLTLMCVIVALAVVEHWCLVLPISDSVLWGWAIGLAARASEGSAETGPIATGSGMPRRDVESGCSDVAQEQLTVTRFEGSAPLTKAPTSRMLLSTTYSRPAGGDNEL